MSGISLILTIAAVHHVRYDRHFHGSNDQGRPRYTRICSDVSVFFIVVAGLSLIIISIFDRYRHHLMHMSLLSTMLLSTLISAVCITVVYYEEMKSSSTDRLLRLR